MGSVILGELAPKGFRILMKENHVEIPTMDLGLLVDVVITIPLDEIRPMTKSSSKIDQGCKWQQ